jgi:hypothetical protein
MKKVTDAGFSLIEGLLCVIALSLIVFVGYYVFHSNQVATKTYNQASNVAQSNPAKQSKDSHSSDESATKLVSIKEWGVKASYLGSSTLSYKISVNDTSKAASQAIFSSSELTAADSKCSGHGGWIMRYAPDANASEDGTGVLTAKDRAAQSDPTMYKLINGYYYFFAHDQAACSDTTAATDLQAQTNSTVQGLVANLVKD